MSAIGKNIIFLNFYWDLLQNSEHIKCTLFIPTKLQFQLRQFFFSPLLFKTSTKVLTDACDVMVSGQTQKRVK